MASSRVGEQTAVSQQIPKQPKIWKVTVSRHK